MTTNTPMSQVVASYVVLFLFYITLVMVSWNVGLVGAGIASKTIDWVTAVGLSVFVMPLRGIAHAAGNTTINIKKP